MNEEQDLNWETIFEELREEVAELEESDDFKEEGSADDLEVYDSDENEDIEY